MGGAPANQLLPVHSLPYLYAKVARRAAARPIPSCLQKIRVLELGSKEKDAVTLRKKKQGAERSQEALLLLFPTQNERLPPLPSPPMRC